VHVQKLFFLIDKRLAKESGVEYFNFQAYDYGPYDKEVYGVLNSLWYEGYIEIDHSNGSTRRIYRLTDKGQERGADLYRTLKTEVQTSIKTLVDFVRSLSFAQLVSAIYRAYPEMKANSVFYGG